jgi:hypothetical protein
MALLLVVAAGSCQEPPVAPPSKVPRPPSSPVVPLFNLVQDSTVVAESLLREVVVQLPESGSADSDLVANLWLPGELSGPAIIEVAGTFQLDAGTLPVTDALTSGALLWYEESIVTAPPMRPPSAAPPSRSGPLPGDIVLITLARQAALSFEALAPGDTAARLGVDLSGPRDSARFVDTAAASHGMQLRWSYVDGNTSLGFPEHLDSACAFVGPFGCAALPPRDSAHLSISQPHGEVRIRVYRAGQGLQVNLTLARDSVGPVLAPLFNAVTQVAESLSPRRRAERTDTVRVEVHARVLPSGQPAAGVVLDLMAAAIANSGGHAHDTLTRPTGTFFDPGQNVDVSDGGTRGHMQITLPASGDTVVIYRTSGVSGRERLRAVVRVGADSQVAMDTIVIRWPGLVEMPRDGANYEFKDQDPTVSPAQRHGNVNNFVEPSFRARALDAFQRYFDVVPAAQRFPVPVGGVRETRFLITDVSLEWGGLLDVDGAGPWHNPHRGHRKGIDMDVRRTTLNAAQRDLFIRLCQRADVECIPETAPVHFHLQPTR